MMMMMKTMMRGPEFRGQRDERASEEDSDSDGSVESSYLDVEDTGFADL